LALAVALPPLRPAAARCDDALRDELPPDFAPPPPPLRRAALPCFAPPLLAPLFFAPLLEPPLLLLLLFDEPPLRELPADFELRDAPPDLAAPAFFEPPLLLLLLLELAFELLDLDELLLAPPRAAAPLLLPPERAAAPRFADDADDFADDFEPPRDADADLLLLDEALPFEDEALFFEPPLLAPPLALPLVRPAAAFFDDAELLELELFADELLFFELPPLLFLDDDDADFLEAICGSPSRKKKSVGSRTFFRFGDELRGYVVARTM